MDRSAQNTGKNFVSTAHGDTYLAIDPSQWDLQGRVVLVTGASRGIGRATAISYAKAGASGVIIAARSSATLDEVQKAVLDAAQKAGRHAPKVLKSILDVTDVASVESAAKKIQQEFGRIDIIVNNAGYMENLVPIVDSEPEDWWMSFIANVRGPYLVVRALLPLLLFSEGGSKVIVNVSSIAAHVVAPNGSAYMASKLALLRLTEFITAEYADKGVIAIGTHPGGVNTVMAQRLSEERRKFLTDTPELAADMTVWLSKERREWLNGRYVSVNWDVNELEEKKEEILARDKLKVRLAV